MNEQCDYIMIIGSGFIPIFMVNHCMFHGDRLKSDESEDKWSSYLWNSRIDIISNLSIIQGTTIGLLATGELIHSYLYGLSRPKRVSLDCCVVIDK